MKYPVAQHLEGYQEFTEKNSKIYGSCTADAKCCRWRLNHTSTTFSQGCDGHFSSGGPLLDPAEGSVQRCKLPSGE